MPTNSVIGSKPAQYVRRDNNGLFIFPGPFIGVVQSNSVQPFVPNRLLVYIPEYANAIEGPAVGNNQLIAVDYVASYAGATGSGTHTNVNGDGAGGPQSWGMTVPSPSIGDRVFCFFVNGDPSQGYWTGVVPDPKNYVTMGTTAPARAVTSQDINTQQYNAQNGLLPFITAQTASGNVTPKFLPNCAPTRQQAYQQLITTKPTVESFPHVYQALILANQGLIFDAIRGTSTSSSTRDASCQLFAINTPGRAISISTPDLAASALESLSTYLQNPQSQTNLLQELAQDFKNETTTGGHQFVMDDGFIDGTNQQIRIRTTNGNEILLDDTNGQIYIVNSTGNCWIEMTPSGRIDIFAANDMSLHSQGNINFHADKNISFNAAGNIQMRGDQGIKLDSGSGMTLRGAGGTVIYDASKIQLGTVGALNTSYASATFFGGSTSFNTTTYEDKLGLPKVSDPKVISKNSVANVGIQLGSQSWWTTGTLPSICPRVPMHEPWPNHEVSGITNTQDANGNSVPPETLQDVLKPVSRVQGPTVNGLGGGISAESGTINNAILAQQPVPTVVTQLTCTNGNILLNQTQIQAIMAALGQQESGGNYSAINPSSDASGKYQFLVPAFEQLGYMYTNSPTSAIAFAAGNTYFTGKAAPDGTIISNIQVFLTSPSAQEAIEQQLLQSNFNILKNKGIINCSTPSFEVAGLLCVAHWSGTGTASTYARNNFQIPDSFILGQYSSSDIQKFCDHYYNIGVNAINVAVNSPSSSNSSSNTTSSSTPSLTNIVTVVFSVGKSAVKSTFGAIGKIFK